MASYTMELREYVEQATQYQTGLSTRDKIEVGRTKLFDFEYPIFDPLYKKVFETNFIRNFYMREIGFETEGLFKFQLETWLLIHMPFFNKMFESELIVFDPLKNMEGETTYTKVLDKNKDDIRDITNHGKTIGIDQNITHQGTVSDEITDSTSTTDSTSDDITDSTSTSDSTSNDITSEDTTGLEVDDDFKRDVKSITPDGRLNITANDGEGVITYANEINEANQNDSKTTESHTDGTKGNISHGATVDHGTKGNISHDATVDHGTANVIASTDGTSNTNTDTTTDTTSNDVLNSIINETEDYIQHRVGKVGIQNYSKMLVDFRHSFVRIEKQMHKEMQELFMLVY